MRLMVKNKKIKSKITILLWALTLVFFSREVYAEDELEPQKISPISIDNKNYYDDEFYSGFKPTYFMMQYGTQDPHTHNKLFSKLQLNFNHPVYERRPLNLSFSYTLKALWDITAASAPFKDYSHNPELFLDYKATDRIGLKLGIEHESNGKAGIDSRSWNRLYLEPRIVYRRPGHEVLGFDTIAIYLKAWYKINGDEINNPDIADFYGNGELALKLTGDKQIFILTARKGLKGTYGNVLTEYMHRLYSSNWGLYFQFWDGYGETLLDYNQRGTRYGIGIAWMK